MPSWRLLLWVPQALCTFRRVAGPSGTQFPHLRSGWGYNNPMLAEPHPIWPQMRLLAPSSAMVGDGIFLPSSQRLSSVPLRHGTTGLMWGPPREVSETSPTLQDVVAVSFKFLVNSSMVGVSLKCFWNFWNLGTSRLDCILEGPGKVWRFSRARNRACPSGGPPGVGSIREQWDGVGSSPGVAVLLTLLAGTPTVGPNFIVCQHLLHLLSAPVYRPNLLQRSQRGLVPGRCSR